MRDVITGKAASIQKCIARAREELDLAGAGFPEDYTRQDAAVMNMTRACEQAIDLANYIIKQKKLGVPSDSGDSFRLLAKASVIPEDLAPKLVRMTGFRNIAVHEYQQLDMDIVVSVIRNGSEDLLRFTEIAVKTE
jgi:uncharacterized protein YutE (UPF0331/DUF86 family)